jgi:hypothetical protein
MTMPDDTLAPLSADELAYIRKSLDCPDGHVCANHPIHAQAKISMLRMHIERLLPIAESAAGLRDELHWRHMQDASKWGIKEFPTSQDCPACKNLEPVAQPPDRAVE